MHLLGRDRTSVSAYFDGCFYWLADESDHAGSDSSMAIIIEFNSVTEAFKVALLPESIKNVNPTQHTTLNIAVHKGSLMLLNCCYVGGGPIKDSDIWVMMGEDDSGLILWERKLYVGTKRLEENGKTGELEVHPQILEPKGLRRMAKLRATQSFFGMIRVPKHLMFLCLIHPQSDMIFICVMVHYPMWRAHLI